MCENNENLEKVEVEQEYPEGYLEEVIEDLNEIIEDQEEARYRRLLSRQVAKWKKLRIKNKWHLLTQKIHESFVDFFCFGIVNLKDAIILFSFESFCLLFGRQVLYTYIVTIKEILWRKVIHQNYLNKKFIKIG